MWTLWRRGFLFSARWGIPTQPSWCYILPKWEITKQVDWTERFCWIPFPFTGPHTTRLLFMGIPKRQSLCIETHNNCWIESNHWTWMHANTEGIASWCVLLHRFALSAVSGPEWTSIWETAVTKMTEGCC